MSGVAVLMGKGDTTPYGESNHAIIMFRGILFLKSKGCRTEGMSCLGSIANISKQNIVLYEEGVMQQGYTMIVNEAFLTVFLNGLEIATLVCSPIAYRELAVGFLLSEGLLQDLGI